MYLTDIEDDEEWEKVADAWQELAKAKSLNKEALRLLYCHNPCVLEGNKLSVWRRYVPIIIAALSSA